MEGELRAALLAIRRGRTPHPRTRMAGVVPGITVAPNEARTLLRAAMPAPVAGSRLRRPHARMAAALHTFGQHLLALNSPQHPRGAALAAAADLQAALSEWQHAARWQDATTRAGAAWPVPIRTLTGLPPRPPAAQVWNIDLPNAAAGLLHHPTAGIRMVRRPAPDLPAAHPEPTDLRQLSLPLERSSASSAHAA